MSLCTVGCTGRTEPTADAGLTVTEGTVDTGAAAEVYACVRHQQYNWPLPHHSRHACAMAHGAHPGDVAAVELDLLTGSRNENNGR
jgi:hypothetical protein